MVHTKTTKQYGLTYIETENYSFSENIYLNWTKVLAKRMNCSRHIARADDNTQVIHSQPSQSKKLNFLAWPDLAFSFVKKRSEHEIISGLLCLLSMWLTYSWTDSVPDWAADWVSDCLVALFAVDVTDLLVDLLNVWSGRLVCCLCD